MFVRRTHVKQLLRLFRDLATALPKFSTTPVARGSMTCLTVAAGEEKTAASLRGVALLIEPKYLVGGSP